MAGGEAQLSFERALWVFPAVIALHNLEEAIWLPRWAAQSRFPSPGRAVFAFAASVLTVLASVSTWLSIRQGRQSFWAYLVFGYMVAMLANVVIPHLSMTVLRRSYMPGLGTGLLLIVPVLSTLAVRAVHERFVSGWPAVGSAVLVPIFLLASLPALFALGRALRL